MAEITTISPAQKALIDKIREIEERDYNSADDMADKLKVNPSHLSRIKRGLMRPGVKFLTGLWSRHGAEAGELIKNYIAGINGR